MVKTPEEIVKIRKACELCSDALGEIARVIQPGLTPLQLDKRVEQFIRDRGGQPAFKGYHGFPNSICVSVNEEIVHGIPNSRKFRTGDIVSVDCGVLLDGYHGDSAYTFSLGKIPPKVQDLLRVTKEALHHGIAAAKSGSRTGDIGLAVQTHVEFHKFHVVRQLSGHGVGKELHEAPEVPNYGDPDTGILLQPGMVLAIEPMVNAGTPLLREANDGWTLYAADRKHSAHFEHTVLITEGEAELLTSFAPIEDR